MQAQRMREIMDQKAGLVFDNIADDYGDDDLAELIGEGKRKRRAQSGKAPKKTSKKSGNEWNVFLKKALKRHGKTMQDYMGNKALRTKISAEYKRSKAKGGAYDDEDYEDSYDDSYEGSAMIGGAKTKKYKAKKKAYRKESTVNSGVQICKHSVFHLDTAGNVIKTKCQKVVGADPENPMKTKFIYTFKFEDEDGDFQPIPQNEAQRKVVVKMQKDKDEAKDTFKFPLTANLAKASKLKGDELLAAAINSNTTPFEKAVVRAFERGDNQRLAELRREALLKVDMVNTDPSQKVTNMPTLTSNRDILAYMLKKK